METHGLYKNCPIVREALMLYYHYTHRKISVLMVLIIEACEAIRLLHNCLKSEFSILFRDFDCTWAQKRP